ncbi:MAG: hypothetical protein Q9190_007958, partial [Brigantiaea leucoxantha]
MAFSALAIRAPWGVVPHNPAHGYSNSYEIVKNQISTEQSPADVARNTTREILLSDTRLDRAQLDLRLWPGLVPKSSRIQISVAASRAGQHVHANRKCISFWETDVLIGGQNLCKTSVQISTVESLNLISHGKEPNPQGRSQSRALEADASQLSELQNLDEDCTFKVHKQVIELIQAGRFTDFDSLGLNATTTAFACSDRSQASYPIKNVDISFMHNAYSYSNKTLSKTFGLDRKTYENIEASETPKMQRSDYHRVYIALGSNVGDRIGMIESACSLLGRHGIEILRTSSLYETRAMYVEDQQSFINGACEAETKLSPTQLLDQLKDIEKTLGRQKSIVNGPRSIDLDILLYHDFIIAEERLTIPHPRIAEREFVLRPLCDLIPNFFPPHRSSLQSFQDQLSALPPSDPCLSPLTPLSSSAPPILSRSPTRPTHIMAILNLTPDSFSSDGLQPSSTDSNGPTFEPSTLLPTLHSLLANKVTILDIGGQSTRPNATPVPPDQELARILPTIRFIRSHPQFDQLVLSIDTFYSSVASAAIRAGANLINDVSAGTMDPEMLPTAAKLGCSIILMHMRGTPQTMSKLTSYPDGVVQGVATELRSRVAAAEAAGIRRWRILLDPGIGFAKTQAQNLELLRRLGELREAEGLKGLP